MARTQAGRQLTELHRRDQIRLGQLVEARLVRVWDQLVDFRAVNSTVNLWIDAAKPLITSTSNVSARLAAQYLTDYLLAETGATAVFPAALPTPPRLIGATLNITARESVWTASKYRPLLEAIDVAKIEAARSAQELTLRPGRETITRAANPFDIRKALGWRRITDGDPCKFCSMLASKQIEADEAKQAGFKAHPGCGCTAEPIF